MVKINENLKCIESENSFAKVIRLTNVYKSEHPDKDIVSLGIGDVTLPIPKKVVEIMKTALEEQDDMLTFKGYGDSSGYEFLKTTILENEYKNMGFTTKEIYISNGTKTDSTNILELISNNSKILISDIMYPIYHNAALCLNRKTYMMPLREEDNFIPKVPQEHYDIIYLCNPNNPIGNAYDYNTLASWVDYAKCENAIIIYDNVYEDFIHDDLPHSIYEIPGAKSVAIELKSFSKSLSFSGIRCSYYIIPKEIYEDVNNIWALRTINRFNGVNYITQRGANAFYDADVQKEVKNNIDYYLENARILKEGFKKVGFSIWGGENAPYLWVKIKENMTSWEIFDKYLKELNIIITPGIIFGLSGDKYFRISALNTRENTIKAIERIIKYYEKDN